LILGSEYLSQGHESKSVTLKVWILSTPLWGASQPEMGRHRIQLAFHHFPLLISILG
jgi:hypothetical protein